jgi:hypothetical protein
MMSGGRDGVEVDALVSNGQAVRAEVDGAHGKLLSSGFLVQ